MCKPQRANQQAGFQSTPPVKAATQVRRTHKNAEGISIHAAREGGDECAVAVEIRFGISIHAAREGGDQEIGVEYSKPRISIHAAREGGD